MGLFCPVKLPDESGASIFDVNVPMEILPDEVYDAFNSDDATLMAIFFDSATSEDVTMDAIREIRKICNKECFVSGMSALVTDLKDLCAPSTKACTTP